MEKKEFNLLTGEELGECTAAKLLDRDYILSNVKRRLENPERIARMAAEDGLAAYVPCEGIMALFEMPIGQMEVQGEMREAYNTIRMMQLEAAGIGMDELISAAERNEAKDISVSPIGCAIDSLWADILADDDADPESMEMQGLGEMVGNVHEAEAEEMLAPLYVLTNASRYHGAYAMLHKEVLAELAEKFGMDLAIFPSGIDEAIALPIEDLDPDTAWELCQIVRESNDEIGAFLPGDKLADGIYYYCRESGNLNRINIGE